MDGVYYSELKAVFHLKHGDEIKTYWACTNWFKVCLFVFLGVCMILFFELRCGA